MRSASPLWLAILGAGLVVATALFAIPGPLTWDSGTYHLMVRSLYRTGGFFIPNGYDELASPLLAVGQTMVKHGQIVSQYPELYTLISLPFCFFTLGQLVSWLIQVQILLRFIWQCAAVILLRRYRPDIPQPFTMWLYPLPALLSLALWLAIFFTGPREGIVFSFAFLAVSLAAYGLFARSGEGKGKSEK